MGAHLLLRINLRLGNPLPEGLNRLDFVPHSCRSVRRPVPPSAPPKSEKDVAWNMIRVPAFWHPGGIKKNATRPLHCVKLPYRLGQCRLFVPAPGAKIGCGEVLQPDGERCPSVD